ncbi:hypothetical protein VPH35_021042 [Triticum aestivum]
MFILRSSCVPLFEAVASYCRLPFHSYVREVASDGSLLGGVEIDVLVREDVVWCQTHFFWGSSFDGCSSLYDQAAYQVVRFLQSSMLAYKGVAQSVVVLAGVLARSTWPLVHSGGQRNTAGVNASVQLQLLYSQLVGSVREL